MDETFVKTFEYWADISAPLRAALDKLEETANKLNREMIEMDMEINARLEKSLKIKNIISLIFTILFCGTGWFLGVKYNIFVEILFLGSVIMGMHIKSIFEFIGRKFQ